MANHYSKINKKGTVLLLIASIGFLIASVWLMQVQIKPKNIGSIEYNIIDLGNKGQDELYYIDKAAEYSLKDALEIKSRSYQVGLTNRQVCNLQLDECQQGKSDCKTNLKLFCEDEIAKAFKTKFTKYLENLNTETGNNIQITDYEFEVREITSNMTAKTRQIEIIGKTTKTIQAKMEDVEYKTNPNFNVKIKL